MKFNIKQNKFNFKTKYAIIKEYPQLENIEITPSKEEQTFKSENYYGYNEVKVNKVSSEIDENIKPENIVKGVEILGVIGTKDGIIPTGTIDIKSNGTYDVKNYESANVSVGNIEKGLVINSYDEDGYPTDVSLLGITEIPGYCFAYSMYEYTKSNFKGYLHRAGANFRLPDGLTSIGNYGFNRCTNLALTSLPNSITHIGEYAFCDCTNLALTSLPDGLTSIGKATFQNCTNLPLTSLPDGLTSIEGNAFYSCTNLALTSLPDGLTSIETYAFYNCTNLALTSLPDGLTSIPAYAFQNCTNLPLTSLPDGLTSMSSRSFNNCKKLKITSLPSAVVSMPEYCFAGCESLIEMTIKGDITSIARNCFTGCIELTKLVLLNVTKVPTLSSTNVFLNTPIASGTGYVYFPDTLVEEAKTKTNWSTMANQIKGVSEL